MYHLVFGLRALKFCQDVPVVMLLKSPIVILLRKENINYGALQYRPSHIYTTIYLESDDKLTTPLCFILAERAGGTAVDFLPFPMYGRRALWA